MALPAILTASLPKGDRPRDEEIDLFGMTHVGKVRSRNEDHFLVCTLHRSIMVHGTSLPRQDQLPLRSERLATVAMVADGVGGAAAGWEASQLAVESVTGYVGRTLAALTAAQPSGPNEFRAALEAAVLGAHEAVLARATERAELQGMATTLTLMISTWPDAYVVQVGDSRCYYWNHGELLRMTRDQTAAQELVDAGALRAEEADRSPLSNVLSSALGSNEARPVVSTMQVERGCAMILCTDGLTRHVSDEEMAEQLRQGTSSEQVCRALVELALERGGADNITVVVARAPVR